MPKTRKEKEKALEELKKDLDSQKSMVFVEYSGLKAEDIFELRKRLKTENCSLKVFKKTLAERAFEGKGFKLEDLEGQLAIVFGFEDPVMPAKISFNFGKENDNLNILGGFLADEFKTKEDVEMLAKIPSKEELYAKVVGSISAPVSNFVRVLQGSSRSLIYALTAIKEAK